jgi:SHAQKYF class myb-like DNA-binding protein
MTSRTGRVFWTMEMHEAFLSAVHRLGANATPAGILREMQVPGLSRKQVGSHWQRYRKDLEHRRSAHVSQLQTFAKEESPEYANSTPSVHFSGDQGQSTSVSPYHFSSTENQLWSDHERKWAHKSQTLQSEDHWSLQQIVCGPRTSPHSSTWCSVQTLGTPSSFL